MTSRRADNRDAMIVALQKERDRLRAEVGRLKVLFLECWACKASLLEPDEPPHCTDCRVDEDAFHAWEEWLHAASPQASTPDRKDNAE